MLQELPSHKLNVISQHFGIRLKHHDALDDARAAAIILLKLMEQQQQFEPLLLADSQGYKAGTMYSGGYTPFKSPPKKAAKKPGKNGFHCSLQHLLSSSSETARQPAVDQNKEQVFSVTQEDLLFAFF